MILDTSLLISFYDKTNSNHEKAVELMEKLEAENTILILSEYVIGETITVLLYKIGFPFANRFMEIAHQTKTFQIVTCSDQDFYSILEIFKSQKYQVSFVDASVVYLAKVLNKKIATFDENILKELKRLEQN